MLSGIIGRIGSVNHGLLSRFTLGPGLIYESHFEPSMVRHARNSAQKYQDRENLEKLTPQLVRQMAERSGFRTGMKRSNHRVLTEAIARAERLRPVLDELATLPASLAAVALNKCKVPSTGGGQWFAAQVVYVSDWQPRPSATLPGLMEWTTDVSVSQLANRRHHGRVCNMASSTASWAAASLAAIRSAVVLSTSAMRRSPRARSRSKSAR